MEPLARALRLRAEEVRRVGLMCGLIGLVIAASYILKPVRSSLFLTRFGAERLPVVYVLIAAVLAVAAAAFSRLVVRCRLVPLFAGMALFFAASLVVFWYAIDARWPAAAYAFYVWVSVIMVLLPSLFWLLANYVFYPNEARRLFGLLTAGGLAGSIVGGAFTSLVVPATGTRGLVLSAAVLLALVAVLVLRIERAEKDRLLERQADLERRERRRYAHRDGTALRLIGGSRYLLLLSALIALTGIVSTIVDYQFNVMADRAFVQMDALTRFFGGFFAVVYAVAFVLQLTVARRLLTRWGVGAGLAFLPLALLVGSTGFLLVPALATAAFLKLSDDGLSNSLNKASVEILFVPIPIDVKNRTKTWLDLVVDRASRGAAGVLILAVAGGLGLGVRELGWIVLGLLVPWLGLVAVLRREYVAAFRHSLARRDIDVGALTEEVRDSQSRGVVEQVLAGSDTRQILYALLLLRGVDDPALADAIARLAEHPSSTVRAAALRWFCGLARPHPLPRLDRLVDDPSPTVAAAAIGLQLRVDPDRGRTALEAVLRSGDVARIHAVLDMADEVDDAAAALASLLDESLVRRYVRSEDEKERALAARLVGFLPHRPAVHALLVDLLQDPSPRVARAAAASAARLREPWLVALLVDQLGRRPLRVAVRSALLRFGVDAEEVALTLLDAKTTRPEVRRALPRLLADFAEPRVVDVLLERLDDEDEAFRHEIIRALGKIRARHPELRFRRRLVDAALDEELRRMGRLAAVWVAVADATVPPAARPAQRLLLRAVDERIARAREHAFRLLGLVYPPDDIFNAWNGLVHGRPAVRAAAIEFLGNLLSRGHRERALPLLESADPRELRREAIARGWATPMSLEEALGTLLAGPDGWLAACAAELAGRIGPSAFAELLRRGREHPDARVREAVERALSSATVA